MRPLPRPLLTILFISALLTSGCGATVEPRAQQGPPPVTVTNCGQQTRYPMPQQPIAYDISGAEKMFALGLADRMRGYVMNSLGDSAIASSPWRAEYDRVERLGTGRISREVIASSRADWVLAGWGSGFSEERGVTPKLLSDLGVVSYLHTETCFNYGPTPVDVPPLEAMYTDLRNLGTLFGVQNRANELVNDLKRRVEAVKRTRPPAPPARVFVYDSGTDQPYTAGRHAPPNDIIAAAGGVNVLAGLNDRWTSVGWEPIVRAQPEVITIVDYGDQPAKDKIAFLESSPAMRSVPAVRNNNYVVMSIGELVTGPRNVRAIEHLAGYLRSIGR